MPIEMRGLIKALFSLALTFVVMMKLGLSFQTWWTISVAMYAGALWQSAGFDFFPSWVQRLENDRRKFNP